MESETAILNQIQQLKSKMKDLSSISCLSEKEITDFELHHQVKLPLAYRLFLTEIGNGWNHILPLKNHLDHATSHNLFNELKHPFLYDSKMQLMRYDEFRTWYKLYPKEVSIFVNMYSFKESYFAKNEHLLYNQLSLFDGKFIYQCTGILEELYYEYQCSANHYNGCIKIQDHGCGMFSFLVVNGKSKGTVWFDDFANSGYMEPQVSRNGGKMEFLEWLKNETDDELD